MTKMSTFRKSATCPQSHDLLAFQMGKISDRERDAISIHVKFCEFCAAEVDFYTHFPQTDEKVESAAMPAPLRELAEALLNNRCNDENLLKRLFEHSTAGRVTDL